MAWLRRRQRRRADAPADGVGSSARVAQLAGAALERLPAYTGASGGQQARRHIEAVYRSLGVALTPAAEGLDHLDAYVLAPLRDAAFLTVLLLDREIDRLERSGMDLRQALEQATVTWQADLGALLLDAERGHQQPESVLSTDPAITAPSLGGPYPQPPHEVIRARAQEAVGRERQRTAGDPFAEREREGRVKQRRDEFAVYGVQLSGGAGAREVARVAFVTVMLVADDAYYKAVKAPPEALGVIYRETVAHFLTGSARLVCDHQRQPPA